MLWDISPELFTKGLLNIRWYNLLFMTGVLGSSVILCYIFAKAGRKKEEAEQLRGYIILGILAGARLGHVIFYQWDYFKDHLLEIFLPITFSPTFKIIGFSGLASHGGGIGIILAVLFYVKRTTISLFPPRIRFKNRRSAGEFLWIVDHLSIVFPLGAALIRTGFMNSEIIGKPTGTNYGVIFARYVHHDFVYKLS